MLKRIFSNILFLLISSVILNAQTPEFSKAGFWEVENSGREVFNFNIGWRFIKSEAIGAETTDFNDSNWEVVNCPHGLELISTEASGSNNYQGEAWYRKHFTVPAETANKILKLHFEGVMGKCKVWLNGELLAEHFGGYLPFTVDLTGKLKSENVIAVWADNSNDPDYPPGKAQEVLDFTYFGGIYRDVWMVATNSIFVTNANEVDKAAGGGVFTHVENLSEESATVFAGVDIQNASDKKEIVSVLLQLKNPNGETVAKSTQKLSIKANSSDQIQTQFEVNNPSLWTPWSPYLYRLVVTISDKNGEVIDGVASKRGIRKIEFKGKDGFYLNNKPYPGKLMGANRHQDYAVVGHAISNNAQWRDAKILKDAGSDIIRAAHYPVDPAFMEACDALGMFYIVATPGWQFWNKKPIFEQRVYEDIRNMVRRDRNYACVLMWEPILNETWYPDYFAKQVHEIVHEEYPFQGAYTVCDEQARGQEVFDVIYSHPFKGDFYSLMEDNTPENRKRLMLDFDKEERCYFTREWGDCVDDWSSHNSPSRVVRGWGEHAQLVQALHYANPPYVYTSWETLYETPRQHIGGALWHSFDHQRGYHPDTFWGGITDVFRQPKYSYQLFASQRDVSENNPPMIFVAHEMSPISEPDIHIFTNCDEVRLTVYEDKVYTKKAADYNLNMPHPVITFEDIYEFKDVKILHRTKKADKASFIAEGLINGKVVATYKRMPAVRPSQIIVSLENNDVPLLANGADFVRIVASVCDQNGNVKRLNQSDIHFEIEGEGTIIGDQSVFANPKKLEWGTAPILVRSTLKAGKIKVKASLADAGAHSPVAGELVFESLKAKDSFVYSEVGKETAGSTQSLDKGLSEQELQKKVKRLEKEISDYKLKEVERQQQEFEGGKK